jgi:hypothetical protein
MRRIRLSVLGTLILAFGAAAPASAITYGELDAGEHPYVGFMIFFSPSDPGWFSCTGTLLDSTTFLTAGHCTFPVGTDGDETAGDSGGNDVWVTFDDTDVLAGWPRRADYPTEEALYAARSAWLDANPDYITGTAYPDPLYEEFADFPNNHDDGVVVLDEAASDADGLITSFGELAPLGTAETLVASSKNKNYALVETAGYGIQAIQPHPLEVETLYKSTSRIVEVTGHASSSGNLHTLNNPSAVGGRGGSCFGDSGGPVLVNNTNLVVAVVSYGFSGTCHGADYSWRVDTQDAYDFILPFLAN